jgi:hypothetical protein
MGRGKRRATVEIALSDVRERRVPPRRRERRPTLACLATDRRDRWGEAEGPRVFHSSPLTLSPYLVHALRLLPEESGREAHTALATFDGEARHLRVREQGQLAARLALEMRDLVQTPPHPELRDSYVWDRRGKTHESWDEAEEREELYRLLVRRAHGETLSGDEMRALACIVKHVSDTFLEGNWDPALHGVAVAAARNNAQNAVHYTLQAVVAYAPERLAQTLDLIGRATSRKPCS